MAKNYCIVEEGSIVNLIVCESDEIAAEFGAIDLGQDASVGMTVIDGKLSAEALESIEATKLALLASEVRTKRDALLAETDSCCLTDRTPSEAMIAYRQALRDITEDEGFPNVTFPEKPNSQGS